MFRKKKETSNYDKEGKVPVIRASICTGEQAAGFKDKVTGRFEEMMLIRREQDLKDFMEQFGVAKEEIRKEW